ncbi:MAG: divalent-cation tolerance protein CutA [Bdellovibrionales bacterium]
MSFKVVYITAPNMTEAKSLGQQLVEEGLCACVNILPQMKSIYRWKGIMAHENEVVLLAKTTQARVKSLMKRVEELHSYDTPCALVLPIEKASKGYGDWLSEQLK